MDDRPPASETGAAETERRRNAFLRAWDPLKELVLLQLRQGVSRRKVAFTLALGVALGVFPILGSTTMLCLAAGILLRLNQPLLQAMNFLVAPLQIALIVAFVRLGEFVFGAEPMPIVPTEMAAEFHRDPAAFLQRFGWSGVHGVTAWALVTLPGVPATAWVLRRLLPNPPARRETTSRGESA